MGDAGMLGVMMIDDDCQHFIKLIYYYYPMVNSDIALLTALCSDEGLTLEASANTLFTMFSISTSTLR